MLLLLGVTTLVVAQSGTPNLPPAMNGGAERHANGDPLRAIGSEYDSRTEAGRKEIEWIEKRLLTDILVALTDLDVVDIVVDVLARSVVVVLSFGETLDDAMKTRVTDVCVLFTGFDKDRIVVLKTPFD